MSDQKKYWKGFDELYESNEFQEQKNKEFAQKLPVDPKDFELKSSRRDFLKFFGFTVSSAALTAACSKTPVKKAIPYVIKPVDMEPGVPNYYASTFNSAAGALPVLVRTREGRPIWIGPNPEAEPFSSGVNALAQGSVLSLYDNARLVGPVANGEAAEWESVDATIIDHLQRNSKQGKVVVVSETINSPSTLEVVNKFLSTFPQGEHVMYDHVPTYGLLKAHYDEFGKWAIPGYQFDKAKTIVSFNADFLGTWISPVQFTKAYAHANAVDDRGEDTVYHVQFESWLSLTGSNADMRMPMKPSQEGAAILALYNHIARATGGRTLQDAQFELAGNSIQHAAKALLQTRGEGIVVSGSNDPGIQALVVEINKMLGNYGKTISTDEWNYQKLGNDEAMTRLIGEMAAGEVGAVIFHGVNPAYAFPNREAFAEAMNNVPLRISLSDRLDETALLCHFVCPDSHYLESWNDHEPLQGFYTMTQPTITPLFKTRQAQESLMLWMGETDAYYDVVRANWENHLQPHAGDLGDFDSFWTKSVSTGVFDARGRNLPWGVASLLAPTGVAAGEGPTEQPTAFVLPTLPAANLNEVASRSVSSLKEQHQEMEIFLYQKVGIQDGKDANNPWLQELPDPITKIVWDNYVSMSKKMAHELEVEDGDIVEVKTEGYTVTAPAHIQPGQPYRTLAIAVGYGHKMDPDAGRIANFVGVNAYPFGTVANGVVNFHNSRVSVTKTGENHPLARTQTHHHIEGRDIIMEGTLDQYVKDPSSVAKKDVHLVSLYKDYAFPGHHWGMAIDLNACTGCGSCVVACQAENNIPVVGKQEVLMRREMHWMRIDRYFSFPDPDEEEGVLNMEKEIDKIDNYDVFDNVRVNFQPMLCQHCDNAPCENVCPVAAISHSSEGLNQQVYNRCVGTRYCENNCPYKVRRFNWWSYYDNDKFDYHMNSELGRMVLNPDVVVRARGVMEKCTFCVQRLQSAKLDAKVEQRPLRDGEAQTACQQACPANAIVFGDMNDPESLITKLLQRDRTFGVLTEIQTKPSVNYMAPIINKRDVEANA